ncbi:MAG: MATE family efflux transporter, partial [Pontibacterium sp.]
MPLARFTNEAKKILTIGWPIIVIQLAQQGMGFFDTLMAGHYSTQDLAAVALGTSIWLPIQVACYGVTIALVARVAGHTGQNNHSQAHNDFIYSLFISGLLGIISFFALWHCSFFLTLLDVPLPLIDKTDTYMKAVAFGFPALMLFQSMRCFYEGYGQTRPVMYVVLAAMIINIPLNYVLIFGELGAPKLGSEGCGLATAISMWVMLILAVSFARNTSIFKRTTPFQFHTPQIVQGCQSLLVIGIPIGATFLVEVSMFTVIALLLADLGDVTIASHQITLSFTGTLFMIPLSISMAISIR